MQMHTREELDAKLSDATAELIKAERELADARAQSKEKRGTTDQTAAFAKQSVIRQAAERVDGIKRFIDALNTEIAKTS